MKDLINLAAFVALSFLSVPGVCADEAPGRTFIIGVSPNLDKPDRESVFKTLVMLALEGAGPRDTLVVYDALNLQPITRLTVPDGPSADQNPRARIQKMKGDIAGLQRFFGAEVHAKPEEAGLIHLPQFLALIGSQVHQAGQLATVIIVGSPFYFDAAEPVFNITNEQYPSDGHLLADQKGSVFGVVGKKDFLNGVNVHFGYLRETFASDTARNRIQRFWTLFVGEQGGVLASFAADLSLVFDRALQNLQQPCSNESIDREDAKIEMHRIVRRELQLKTEPRKAEVALVAPPAAAASVPPTPALEVKQTASELKLSLGGDILFEFDRAEIRSVAEPTLDQVVKMIQAHLSASVLIDGYTDAKGASAYNLKLSDRRAASVKAWLISRGIPEQNVWARGWGAEKPIAANTRSDGSDDPDGRQRNRRVEITIKK